MDESVVLTITFHDIFNDEVVRGRTKSEAIIAAGKAIGLIRDSPYTLIQL